MTVIGVPTDPVTARHPRVVSLVSHAADIPDIVAANHQAGRGHPKFRNDHGVPEIRIGVREFECIGVSPPQDHPHIYINIGEAETILCPYCGTRFRFDPQLTELGADPPDSVFADS